MNKQKLKVEIDLNLKELNHLIEVKDFNMLDPDVQNLSKKLDKMIFEFMAGPGHKPASSGH